MAASSTPTRKPPEPTPARPARAAIEVVVGNRQRLLGVDRRRLRQAVRAILGAAGVARAEISVAVVDDPTIAALHARFLHDPEPTDVITFGPDEADGAMEGEIVVSAQTAAARAAEFGMSAADELLLYVVHGTLHLVGYDDRAPGDRRAMRRAERRWMQEMGVTLPTRVCRRPARATDGAAKR